MVGRKGGQIGCMKEREDIRSRMFDGMYQDRKVLVTGHTGFKGSWLTAWLHLLGSRVAGLSLPPPTTPNHYDLIVPAQPSIFGDVRDMAVVARALREIEPEIIFHLAAQPSVLESYAYPVDTLATNVLGTAHLLEACRHTPSIRVVVVITTDKCYENKEWPWGYRENDALGGHDPYSTSKACVELVAACYRKSFYTPRQSSDNTPVLVATARAGNVIGGGDWTADRLIPDAMRASAAAKPVLLRNPSSSRPWQHVLEPLSGYLLLGERLLAGDAASADAWNFGPTIESNLSVGEVAARLQALWPAIQIAVAPAGAKPHEAGLLMLDSAKACRHLQWRPVWNLDETLAQTVAWYRAYYERGEVLTVSQIENYVSAAQRLGIPWTR